MSTADFEQYADYTEWYVWAKRNLSIESSVCHAAAAAASGVIASGGTREQAIEAARRSFSSGAHALPDPADVRRRTYAEWFDWARRELGGVREQQHAAAAAALRTLDQGQGANLAMANARAAAGMGAPEGPPAPPTGPSPAMPYAPLGVPTAPPPPPPAPPPYYSPPGHAYGPPPMAVPASTYAGFWRRLAAFLLDTLIGGAAWSALVSAITLVVLGVLLGTGSTLENYSSSVPGWLSWTFYGVGLAMTWLYYTLLEASRWQATIGKRALHIQVTDGAGARLTWLRANGRYWAKLLSFLILGIGFLMILFTERRQGLHDLIAGTLVSRRPPS